MNPNPGTSSSAAAPSFAAGTPDEMLQRMNKSYIKDVEERSKIMYTPEVAEKVLKSPFHVHLPFFKPFYPPTVLQDAPPVNPGLMAETCASKLIIGGVTGVVLGVGLGFFMGAMGDVSPIQVSRGREIPQAPLREQVRAGWKGLASKSMSWGRSFGVLTALFGGIECVIEKHRAAHDVWNAVFSGCAVGATLSAKGGPAAACIGCMGFAGFSLVADKVMSAMGEDH